MSDWKRCLRCKTCGKVYDDEIPEICVKCGTVLGMPSAFMALFGMKRVFRTTNCEEVIAKRTLLGWKVRPEDAEDAEDALEQQEDATQTTSASGCCARQKMDGTTL